MKPPLAWLAVASLVVAIFVSAAFFMGDRHAGPKTEVFSHIRSGFDTVIGPVESVVSAPAHWVRQGALAAEGYVRAGDQNRRLKAQLAQAGALSSQIKALTQENARLRALLGVKTDPPLPMVGARAVLDSRGPFANTRLADVGSDQGVIEGNPVLSEHGLVGRVIGVSRSMSRILLLTDLDSRVPVLVERTNARAILTGDGGPSPKLAYLRTHDALRDGDRVLTSGDGGVIPRGLPVGLVVRSADGWRVALDSDAAPIDFVRILLFRNFSQLVPAKALAPTAFPSLATAPPPPLPQPPSLLAPAKVGAP